MRLSAEDAQAAYRLHWALMAYANRDARVVPRDVAPEDIGRQPMERAARLHEAWQKNPHVLEEFLARNPADLSPDELAIVASWRHRVSGTFVILRYLKPYAVFMSQEKEPHLYGVQSLHDSFQALMHGASRPIMVRATLLPFRGRIIYDGILGLCSVTFGPGLRARLAREYQRLRGREGIIEQLVGADGRPEIRTSLSRPAPRKPGPRLAPDPRRDLGAGREHPAHRYEASERRGGAPPGLRLPVPSRLRGRGRRRRRRRQGSSRPPSAEQAPQHPLRRRRGLTARAGRASDLGDPGLTLASPAARPLPRAPRLGTARGGDRPPASSAG